MAVIPYAFNTALFHFHQSLEVFNQKDYPAQYVVICIFMAQLFRERTGIMIEGRSYLVKSGQVCMLGGTLVFDLVVDSICIYLPCRLQDVTI